MSYLEGIGINIVLQIIAGSVKNPDHALKFKQALLKIRNAINGLYPGE